MDKYSVAAGVLFTLSSSSSLSSDFGQRVFERHKSVCDSGNSIEIIQAADDDPIKGEVTLMLCPIRQTVPVNCELIGKVFSETSEGVVWDTDGASINVATIEELREASVRALKLCPPV